MALFLSNKTETDMEVQARNNPGAIQQRCQLTSVLLRPHPPLSENIIQRYGSLPGALHTIELEKGKTGLGLSLAGNRDRSRMSVFVVGIDPSGAAGRDGRMAVGDELLEVRSVLIAVLNSSRCVNEVCRTCDPL